jgi:hypothetical protein
MAVVTTVSVFLAIENAYGNIAGNAGELRRKKLAA